MEAVLLDMKGSASYSIMVDESTDVGVIKQLVLYGRAVVNEELKTRFLIIVELSDGRAPTVVEVITTYLESVNLKIDSLSLFILEDVTTGLQVVSQHGLKLHNSYTIYL